MDSQRTLFLAGMTAAAAIALSAVSLTIAVIAGLSPPVNEHLTSLQNEQETSRIQWLWLPTVICLGMSIIMLAQAFMRKPLFGAMGRYDRDPAMASMPFAMLAIGAIGLFFAARGLATSFEAIRAIAPRPITDSPAFSSLTLPFGVCGMLLSICSGQLFTSWWRAAQPTGRVATT